MSSLDDWTSVKTLPSVIKVVYEGEMVSVIIRRTEKTNPISKLKRCRIFLPAARSPQPAARVARPTAPGRMTRRGWSCAWLSGVVLAANPAWAVDGLGSDIQRRQAIHLEQSQIRRQVDADILSANPELTHAASIVVAETPCFTLASIEWRHADAFPWLTDKTTEFAGRCLGAASLKRLRDHLTLTLEEGNPVGESGVFNQASG